MNTDNTDMSGWKARLETVRENNNTAAWAMSEYIDESPAAITPALIKEADPDGLLPEEALYAAFMAGFCGIPEDDRTITGYFMESVRRLDRAEYEDNPYIMSIRFPDVARGHWRFTHYTYRPYEAFIRDDIKVEQDSREIPQTGYFREPFRYPAVEQDGREWMAVKPSEIETMRPHIDAVSGNIVTFGLGLGYYTFMASEKPEVVHIDVVERDEEVIELFTEHILPQFRHRNKVTIIKQDAFSYLADERMKTSGYDYAFADLWHDTSDGLDIYLRMKRIESVLHADGVHTTFLYWVERSLLSAYRWTMFDHILKTSHSVQEALTRLSDGSLAEAVGTPAQSSSAGMLPE